MSASVVFPSRHVMLSDLLGVVSTDVGSVLSASNFAAIKTLLSLDSVENKTSATIRGELTSANVTTALTFTPLDRASNLSDLAAPATARGNLGSTTVGDALFIASTASAARTTLGLGSAAVLTAGTAANNAVQLDGSAKLPALDGSQLTGVTSTPGLTANSRSANYTALTTDAGKVIEFTGAGPYTLALTAAATLGAAWSAWIDNRSTGIVTIDPNSSETIDGLTTILVYPGERFLVRCNVTLFRTIGRQRRVLVETYTVSGSPTTISIETAFADPEAVEVQIELDALTGSSAQLTAVLKAAGAYITTGTYTYIYQEYLAGTANSGGNANNGSDIKISSAAGTETNGSLRLTKITGGSPHLWWNCNVVAATYSFGNGVGYNNSPITLQGVRIGGTTFSSGIVRSYIVRD